MGVLETTGAVEAQEPAPEDQRLLFARYQLAKLVEFVAAGLPAEACAAVLERTGRECAGLGRLGAQLKGNPEGYFAATRKGWGTGFTRAEENGTVRRRWRSLVGSPALSDRLGANTSPSPDAR